MTAIGATVTLDLLDVIMAQIHREDVKSHIRSSKQYKAICQPVTEKKESNLAITLPKFKTLRVE